MTPTNDELAVDGAKPLTFLTCPFCGEDDFDAIGLKLHLMLWCEEFDKTPLLAVMSQMDRCAPTNDERDAAIGKLWWLSFVGDEGNRGVVITEAPSMIDAIKNAHRLKINPGGEVLGVELDPNGEDAVMPRDRLISPQELKRSGYRKMKEMSDEERTAIAACFQPKPDMTGRKGNYP